MERDRRSTTTERGSSKGEPWRGEKKAQHKFSSAVPESKKYGMEQFMKESQGPRGTAPWVAGWSFPKSGGGQQK